MKTLDEVIAELYIWDTCDKYPESFYDDETTRDALHYLREYQKLRKALNLKVIGNEPILELLIDVLRGIRK